MIVELKLLIASVVLGLVHLIASSHLISWQRGYRWTASSREEEVPPLRGIANRVDQATTNFLETFPFFAALVLLARVTNHHSLLTVIGAHFYFWGRLGYLLAAAARYSLLRSVLCWNAAVIGIVLLLIAILCERPTTTPNQTMKLTATAVRFGEPFSMTSLHSLCCCLRVSGSSLSFSR
jgi:uncharacterized MAPEG superfamily protein